MKHALIVVVALAVVWWLFFRRKPTNGVIQGDGPDFDPVTASQLGAVANGDVTIGDGWSASFINETGDWTNAYKTQANQSGVIR